MKFKFISFTRRNDFLLNYMRLYEYIKYYFQDSLYAWTPRLIVLHWIKFLIAPAAVISNPMFAGKKKIEIEWGGWQYLWGGLPSIERQGH